MVALRAPDNPRQSPVLKVLDLPTFTYKERFTGFRVRTWISLGPLFNLQQTAWADRCYEAPRAAPSDKKAKGEGSIKAEGRLVLQHPNFGFGKKCRAPQA